MFCVVHLVCIMHIYKVAYSVLSEAKTFNSDLTSDACIRLVVMRNTMLEHAAREGRRIQSYRRVRRHIYPAGRRKWIRNMYHSLK